MEVLRTKYLDILKEEKDSNFIKILTGIRRVGKSTILDQFKQTFLNNENIIELNFNEAENVEKYNWKALLTYIRSQSKPNVTNYVFLDEIQEIKEFEKTIISLFEDKKVKYDIFITGSNSRMFSTELVTLFTGRTMEIQVLPFSYKEIVESTLIDKSTDNFNTYLLQGGIGLVISSYNNFSRLKKLLEIVLVGCIEKDIKIRHRIKYIQNIRAIAEYLYNHIGRNISALNLENYLKSNKETKISANTIWNYFNWLTDAFLFYKVRYFNLKGKSILSTKTKYYASDLGLLTIGTNDALSFNLGYRLENAVFLKLIEEGYQVYTGQDRYGNEIDFVIKKNNVIKYIQVCDKLNDDNFFRESWSLLNMHDGNEKIIITLSIEVSDTKGIKMVQMEDFLLDKVKV
ncbi:MAG: ATP-binding protein [Mycoplasmataceae bacterium]|nr:ATP-binding protein [Mycoplasmataceae bacterium]